MTYMQKIYYYIYYGHSTFAQHNSEHQQQRQHTTTATCSYQAVLFFLGATLRASVLHTRRRAVMGRKLKTVPFGRTILCVYENCGWSPGIYIDATNVFAIIPVVVAVVAKQTRRWVCSPCPRCMSVP